MEHSGEVWELAISTYGSVILSEDDDDDSIMLSDAETDEKFGNPIDAAGWTEKLVICNNGATIACSSALYDSVQHWNTKTGEPVGEQMIWREGQHALDEMRRARLCGGQKCDTVARKDTFPAETEFRAIVRARKKLYCSSKTEVWLFVRGVDRISKAT